MQKYNNVNENRAHLTLETMNQRQKKKKTRVCILKGVRALMKDKIMKLTFQLGIDGIEPHSEESERKTERTIVKTHMILRIEHFELRWLFSGHCSNEVQFDCGKSIALIIHARVEGGFVFYPHGTPL